MTVAEDRRVAQLRGIPGLYLVWIAVLIFASANSIVLFLFDVGAQNRISGRNPINFCNVLFAGNACAWATMIVVYRKQWTRAALSKLNWKDWASLVVLAFITGAAVPTLMFLALINSSVTNTILVGRIEPLILIVLSLVILRERLDTWASIGAVVCFAGVAVTFLLQSDGALAVGKGELQAAAAAALTAIATVIAKIRLQTIPIGIFMVVRTGLGTLTFFCVTLYLLGFEHFMDLRHPLLWQLMFLYGAVIVVGGQVCWFTGIKTTKSADISLASSFTPIAGVGFAYLLLGEVPDTAIYVGGLIVVAGLAVGQIGTRKSSGAQTAKSAGGLLEAERETTFKGV